ncbi:protein LSM14 homolog A-like isoform X2 [Homarus americanus]|uniref:protein LSM14 homolog A-like isoform X2 n=1 Tax=Homarus americanus TaxID=6706 RepID=UPI001C463FEC|nr:protein LSM14 homolog A-like isoform X2 [Homarus americanus]
MSGPIPFLGSKISLISKSEIRYEGILYTIDAQESIIALAKVRSFGTEDRPTEMPVPARDEVYEYIIFRGTDIKKIEVCDTPKQPTLPGGLHNDPAIVQHSAPAVPSSFQAAPFSRQSLGPIGGGLGLSYSAYGQSMTQQGIPGAGGFPMGSTSQPSELSTVAGGGGGGNLDQPSGTAPVAVQAPIGPPPQSGTHALHQTGMLSDILVGSRSSTPTTRKSPVSDAGVQVSPPPTREEKKKSPPQQQRQAQQERPQRNGNQGGQNRRSNQQQTQQQMVQQQAQQQNQQQQPQQNHSQQQQYHNNQYYQYHQQQYQGRGGGLNRGRGSRRASGQRGRGQIFNQGSRQRQFQDRQLFEKDYDFEQANEEFEELRNQLAKTKITENGDKKDDSGHETAGGDDVDDQSTFYDKSKSFFDSISCEAIERSKGKSQRPDWRLERKINVETFGVSSARRGYYPRGRGGYYRGGYYRTYNYNQGYYRGGSGGYRGGRSSGGRGGIPNVNGMSQRGGGAGNSYASAVRNSTPTK